MRGATILTLLLAAALIPALSHANWPSGLGVRATGLLPVDFETDTRSRGGEAGIVYAVARTTSLGLIAGTYTRREGRKDEWLKSLVASVEVSPPSRLAPWAGFGFGVGRQRQAFDYQGWLTSKWSRFDESAAHGAMSVGGGLRFGLSPRVNLRTGVEMRSVGGDSPGTDAPSLYKIQFFCWTASLEFFPGR